MTESILVPSNSSQMWPSFAIYWQYFRGHSHLSLSFNPIYEKLYHQTYSFPQHFITSSVLLCRDGQYHAGTWMWWDALIHVSNWCCTVWWDVESCDIKDMLQQGIILHAAFQFTPYSRRVVFPCLVSSVVVLSNTKLVCTFDMFKMYGSVEQVNVLTFRREIWMPSKSCSGLAWTSATK
jgi:hypothetical protein